MNKGGLRASLSVVQSLAISKFKPLKIAYIRIITSRNS